MNKVTTVAVDLGKKTFQIGFADQYGREAGKQERLTSREAFSEFVANADPRWTVLMEVGWGAQAWARAFKARGMRVRLLPAQLVMAHRTGAKNDRNDVLAILRAGQDQHIHEVPVKSAEEAAIQSEHRVRRGWVRRRTAVANQARGLLADQGMVFAKGDAAFVDGVERTIEDAGLPIPDGLRQLLQELLIEWRQQGARIHSADLRLERLVREHPVARMLDELPGVGPIGATALACKMVDLERFANARHFAASFGIVPEQHSSSDRVRLGHMSKRGDSYIRATLISGARAVFRHLPARKDNSKETQRLRRWYAKHGCTGASIRLANRNLRIAFIKVRNSMRDSA